MPSPQQTGRLILLNVVEFEALFKHSKPPSGKRQTHWSPPPAGVYKVNTDATFPLTTGHGGWGFVARDDRGTFVEGGAGSLEFASSVLHAEAQAVLRCLERVAFLGMPRIIVETDAAQPGHALWTDDMDRSIHGCLLHQIKSIMYSQFESCVISICPRTCYRVADSLASFGERLSVHDSVYMSMAPEFVTALVSSDLPRATV